MKTIPALNRILEEIVQTGQSSLYVSALQDVPKAFVVDLGNVVHPRLNGFLHLLIRKMDPTCGLPVALLVDRPHVHEKYEDSDKIYAVADEHSNSCISNQNRLPLGYYVLTQHKRTYTQASRCS